MSDSVEPKSRKDLVSYCSNGPLAWQAAATARCPCVCLAIGYFVALVLVFIAVGGSGMEPNIPGNGRNVYAVLDFEGTKKHDAMLLGMASVKVGGAADPQSTESTEFIMLNYAAEDDNVLTLERIREIQEVEKKIIAYPRYDKMCLRIEGKCDALSLVAHLTDDGTIQGNLPATQSELDTKIAALVLPASPDPDVHKTQFMAAFHFDDEFGSNNLRSAMTRSYFKLGLPLEGYEGQNDRNFEQRTKQADWTLELSDDVLDKERDPFADQSGMDYFYLGGQAIVQKHVNNRISMDLMFAVGSFVFVWCYMWYHTESGFLASSGMFLVLLAFPAARTVSQYLFGVAWFDFLNQLLLFLLLGIGADNLFVIVDAFKQSEFVERGELGISDNAGREEFLRARIQFTLNRASRATFTTSVTTAGAFFANVFSRITPTAGFGIFAGTMVLLNFSFCLCVFPAAISVHHYYLQKQCSCCMTPCALICRKRASEAQQDSNGDWSIDQFSGQEKFYYNKVSPFIIRLRFVFVGVMALISITGIALTSQLDAATESPKFMPDDDDFQLLYNRIFCSDGVDHCYAGAASSAVVNNVVMVWGIKNEPNREGFSRFDFFTEACENTVCGDVVWDDAFDAAQPAVQDKILAACQAGLSLDSTVQKVHCVMDDFKDWLAQNRPTVTFPVASAQFHSNFQAFLDYSDANGVRPWRTKYVDSRLVGYENGQLKYIMIGWSTQLVLGRLYPYDALKVVYDEFMGFENEQRNQFRGIQGGGEPFLCEANGHEAFLVMMMSKEFQDSVYRGVIISLVVAMFTLLFSTGNLIVAGIALVTIFLVTMCTMGSMFLYDWKIGVIEAICAVLVVGFSVDYTVHLGIAYVERRPSDDGKYKLGSTRGDRVTHSFFELGTSVVGGASTTLGASLFLFLCRMQIFKIFGIFICTVIFWSLIFSHIFFMPLCAWFGPEGERGDLPALRDVYAKLSGKSPAVKAKEVEEEPKPAKELKIDPEAVEANI